MNIINPYFKFDLDINNFVTGSSFNPYDTDFKF